MNAGREKRDAKESPISIVKRVGSIYGAFPMTNCATPRVYYENPFEEKGSTLSVAYYDLELDAPFNKRCKRVWLLSRAAETWNRTAADRTFRRAAHMESRNRAIKWMIKKFHFRCCFFLRKRSRGNVVLWRDKPRLDAGVASWTFVGVDVAGNHWGRSCKAVFIILSKNSYADGLTGNEIRHTVIGARGDCLTADRLICCWSHTRRRNRTSAHHI